MDSDVAVRVEGVSKDFHYTSNRASSLKGVFTGIFNQKDDSKDIQHALKDISFEIKKGEFFGIVGRNGGGKSTLLKIIAGIYQPTKGKTSVNGKLVPFIELGVGFNPELTGKENVYLNGALLGFSKKEVDGFYNEVVEFAELEKFMNQKLKNYSSGMQVRLAFSMAIRANADILLVDEVLAVGDADFQRKCFSYFKKLKKDKTTVIFVTHDMNSVREYCDRALLVNESMVEAIGSPDDIARKYSLLFIKDNTHHGKDEGSGKRWGNGKLRLESAKAKVSDEEIIVTTKTRVIEDIDRVMYGLHIVSQDGSEVTAVNNRMILQEDIRNLKKGNHVEFLWKIQNIFNDGKYDITLTYIDDVNDVLEWVTGATAFTVRRPERSTTSVLPPITVSTETN